MCDFGTYDVPVEYSITCCTYVCITLTHQRVVLY